MINLSTSFHDADCKNTETVIRFFVLLPSIINTEKKMKQFLFTFIFVVLTVFCFAQDIIVTTDARKIEAKILEISETEVKYKENDNLEGPTFIISTNNISSIVYANGKVTLYQQSSTEEKGKSDIGSEPSYITRLGDSYTYKGYVMKGDAYANFLRNNCLKAYEIYHKGYVISYAGVLFLSVGVGLEVGTLIGGAIVGGYFNMPVVYCGLGCLAASIPLVIVGYDKMHQSVDVFNQECALNPNRTHSFWSINASQHGIGLAFNF